MADDESGLVRVRVIADDVGDCDERCYEYAMVRRTSRGGVAGSYALR